jgi:uncharacterized membrane protein
VKNTINALAFAFALTGAILSAADSNWMAMCFALATAISRVQIYYFQN